MQSAIGMVKLLETTFTELESVFFDYYWNSLKNENASTYRI